MIQYTGGQLTIDHMALNVRIASSVFNAVIKMAPIEQSAQVPWSSVKNLNASAQGSWIHVMCRWNKIPDDIIFEVLNKGLVQTSGVIVGVAARTQWTESQLRREPLWPEEIAFDKRLQEIFPTLDLKLTVKLMDKLCQGYWSYRGKWAAEYCRSDALPVLPAMLQDKIKKTKYESEKDPLKEILYVVERRLRNG